MRSPGPGEGHDRPAPRDDAAGSSAEPKRPARFPARLEALDAPLRVARTPVVPAVVSTVLTPAPRLAPMAAAARAVLRPQRPVEHAHADAGRRRAPTGLGLDSADVRRRMTDRLRAAGLAEGRVIEALATVPRHAFVDAALVGQAYEDTSLPIGHGQTISKPSVVGRMLELLGDGASARASRSLGRVLEIGTGCGYQAAVLALLGSRVVSIERLRPLHDKARALLAPLRLANVRLLYGDGRLGHAASAPYDSIIAAAGGDEVPAAWLDQLAVGGRLVSPVRDAGSGWQTLVVVDRTEHGYERSTRETVRFVPLKSGVAAS